MARATDAIVVGGGVIGCSIAYHLLQEGLSVRLLEGEVLGAGTTNYSPAIIRQNYADMRVAKLARESIRRFENWQAEIGGSCGLVQTGFLTAFTPSDREMQVERAAAMRRLGIVVELLSTDDLCRLVPDFNAEGMAGGLFEPGGGFCDALSTIAALRDAVRARDGIIQEKCWATKLRLHGDRVVGVETASGAIDGGVVVNAAGVWSAAFAAASGFPLPIEVTRHCIAMLELPRTDPQPRLPAYQERGLDRMYMRPAIGGLTLVGSFDPADSTIVEPESCDTHAEPDKLAQFRDRAANRIGRLRASRARGGWASMFDDTPDGNPLVGADPRIDGLFIAAGMNGHCFKLAPVIGRGLAEIVANKTTDLDLDVFAPRRLL